MKDDEYWVPEHVRAYLTARGYALPLEAMEPYVREWAAWMDAKGEFYAYQDTDGFGRAYEVHRRSLHPAMRVCREWGSLILNDKTQVVCDNQECTDYLAAWLGETDFLAAAQACVVRAFGLGTGAWALWVDTAEKRIRVRNYDARMVVPLTWDEDGVTECAFVTRAYVNGKPIDQLQLHLKGYAEARAYEPDQEDASRALLESNALRYTEPKGVGSVNLRAQVQETYRIETVCFDGDGNQIEPEGVLDVYETGSATPSFALVKPALENTRVDMSPYGQSVFADALGAVQAVDLAFDALFNEVDVSKMRVFLSDVLFESERTQGGKRVSIPFGKQDCTVFRKVMSTEDTIREFAPALRTEQQERALRVALQMLGDLAGFGISYFDFDNAGYVKTATEVSSDNSALMRNIRRHENALQGALVTVCRSVLAAARALGEELPAEGEVRVSFDDSIITDTQAEKTQDMAEVAAGLLQPWEYRMRWYGEDEATAKSICAEGSEAAGATVPE